MASKNQEVLPPSIPSDGTPIYIDEELATETRKNQKCIKIWLIYIVIFLVFQTVFWVIIDLTILRIQRPKYRLQSITIANLNTSNSATSLPSFDMELRAEVTFKNQNFGPYNYEYGYMTFSYKGTPVGEAVINASSAKTRSTKKTEISLKIDSKNVRKSSNLGRDIESGSLILTSDSNLRGQVELISVIKKDKEAIMKCTIVISLSSKVVEELNCD